METGRERQFITGWPERSIPWPRLATIIGREN
jgi:hypothetical protein